MEQVMIRLLNMSITASCAAVFVIVLRLFFKRLPKRFTYVLWLVVIFRFLCPISLPSPYSLLPVYSEPVEENIVYETTPSIDSGMIFIDRPVNRVLSQTMAVDDTSTSVNPIQIALFLMVIIWEAGMLIFFLYHFAGYIRLKGLLATAVKKERAVYESDRIPGAFVMGIVRPVIYLPADLPEEERECILAHERIHIRRRDYLVKLLGLLMVMVHWFNPFAYITFRLFSEDMEMACDEAVVNKLGEGGKKQYSTALLAAAKKEKAVRLPLAFGENHTKSRIKNVLKYKKAGLITVIAAVIITGAVSVGLMTGKERPGRDVVSVIGGQDGPTSIFIAGKIQEEEGETAVRTVQMPDTSWLAQQELEKGSGNTVTIDFASKEQVIFHGSCGLFHFALEDGVWVPKMILGPEEMKNGDSDSVNRILDTIKAEQISGGSIHRDEAFVEQDYMEEGSFIDYDAVKLADGSVAVLGGMRMSVSAEGTKGRLADVFYGWYNPEDMVMHQVYLFAGDGVMTENGKGVVKERMYLFSADQADYFLRTPETALEFEYRDGEAPKSLVFPYGRQELVRRSGENTVVLDSLAVSYDQRILLAEDRIYYRGAAEPDLLSFKSPSLIGIRMDGSGRKIAEAAYDVFGGLCYDNGYLYFEGWSNAGTFLRPICRMKPDFSEVTKIGEFPGCLISVVDGTFYMLSAEKPAIVLTREGHFDEVMYYDKCGFDAKNYDCAAASVSDGSLRITFWHLTGNRELVDYEISLADKEWWK